jgi:hypothetical protein
MTLKETMLKEIGSALAKSILASLVGSSVHADAHNDASSSTSSNAWKEIEEKLQGLFSGGDESKENHTKRDLYLVSGATLLILLAAAVYLYSRHRSRTADSTERED